jgi:hypothetical protein
MADFSHLHSGVVYDVGVLEALQNWKEKQPPDVRGHARALLRDYLFYVNLNLVLSARLNAAVLDWKDFQPFYEAKISTGRTNRHGDQAVVDQSRKLFEILFPFSLNFDGKKLLKAFEDKRVESLRAMVRDAASGKVSFDSEFAIRTLHNVLQVEAEAVFRRKITGWVTLPLGFLPGIGTPVQKAAEELINRMWAEKVKKPLGWFYLISEMAVNDRHPYVQDARKHPLERI